LNACLSYGWQPKNEYVSICPKKSKRLNVFELLANDNDLQIYSTNCSVSSDLMIALLDDFALQIKQKTVVVLDNDPIHHSEKFQKQIAIWEEQHLYIFFQPRYNRHLYRGAFRIIERLLLKAKCEWLKLHHYELFEILTTAGERILNQIDSTFKIDFSEIKHFTEFKTLLKFE